MKKLKYYNLTYLFTKKINLLFIAKITNITEIINKDINITKYRSIIYFNAVHYRRSYQAMNI